MRPEELRRALSRYVDGDLSPEERRRLEEQLASEPAQEYLARLRLLRRHLRYEADLRPPDVTGSVLEAIRRAGQPRRSRRVSLGAAFAAGVLAGATFIGLALRPPAQVAAADIPALVLGAQSDVESLTARIHIIERGWHPQVSERTFTGTIVYRAPESIWIEIRDDTTYPSEGWVANHTTVVVDEDLAWSRGTAGCPTEALPGCLRAEPRLTVLANREPFPEAAPAPLDLIVPAAGFTRAGEPELIGFKQVGARQAIGVEVTAAQVAALLDGLTGSGNWRDVHPTDTVELWLDRDALVPLELSVFPADTPDRRLWAIGRRYLDDPRVPVLEVSWSEVELNGLVPGEPPGPPPGVADASAGFLPGALSDLQVVSPRALPEGMTLHRSGVLRTAFGPTVSVASWSDGRAWLKVRWTEEWTGERLFGDLGGVVRPVTLGSGIGYLSEQGDRVGIHGPHIDLVVMGSLPTGTLLEVAAGLGVFGLPVPADWEEAPTATLEEARGVFRGLLVPRGLDGFGPPAVKIDPDVVTLSYAGPGNRGFQLIETTDAELSPPLEANVRGVVVRGVDGRYTPSRGLLEWVEGDLALSLKSTTLSLEELVVIAATLRSP